ncbi:MAG: helix-turn-helix domain-containing protein [Ignavibacteriales bacterium]|nr:helix-turn-helix domain-containing protein [Ignavibacteriales bacterium]
MIGIRIKQARLAAGFSLRELAEKTDNYISAQVIHKYELGKSMPGSDVLLKLTKALGVKMEFFFRPLTQNVSLSLPAYRKRATASVKHLQSVQSHAKDWVEKYLEVESLFSDHRVLKVSLPKEQDRFISKLVDVEHLTKELRKHWKLGIDPIEHLTEVLEDRGVKVVMLEGEDDFDGLSCWANDEIPVIVVKKNQTSDRLRFSIAHELGHLLMKLSSSVNPEKASDRFAGSFLVPEEAVRLELGESRNKLSVFELRSIRKKYGMSIQAWIYRAKDVGVITENYATSIFRLFKKLGIHTKELGDQLPSEQPKRYERLVIQAVEEGLLSPARAAELLGISLNEFRKNLKGGFERSDTSS